MGNSDNTGTAAATAVESEEISDNFICCVCLDLMYKPIVLPCGHVCCFWCVHKSMNGIRSSHCPYCRLPYNHFPTICHMLHFLLLKMYPIEYKRREEQILVEEEKTKYFSPQLDFDSCGSHVNQEYDQPRDSEHSSITSLATNSCSEPCSTSKGEPNGECKLVQLADVQCTSCKQLLYRPVVLNCGHGYCESCIVGQSDKMLRCQACQLFQPKGSPKVSLDLDHFLEKQFPREYVLRREAVQLKQARFESSSRASKEEALHPPNPSENHGAMTDLKVHFGVGCDFCGIYPIIGDRYQCKDCVERIGFDLCGDCYSTRSKRPGRFNQQHTPEHKLELIRSNFPSHMSRLVHQHLDGLSLFDYDYPIEITENESFDSDAVHLTVLLLLMSTWTMEVIKMRLNRQIKFFS